MSLRAGLSQGSAAAEALMAGDGLDPSLPALGFFLDMASAREWCQEHLPAHAGVDPASLSHVRPLRYRAGRRCTLSLEFCRPRTATLYAKLFRPGRSNRVAMRHMILSSHELPGLRWPRVLTHVESCDVVMLSQVPGVSLVDLMTEPVLNSPPACRSVGIQLAGFHQLAAAGVGSSLPRRSGVDELADVRKFISGGGTATGLPGDALEPLLAQAAIALADCETGEDVLLHRDLHPQQILVTRQGVGLVDLDNLAMGPAEIDLGNLLAHFDLLESFHAAPDGRLQGAGEDLLAAYGERGPVAPATVQLMRAVALMRLAGLYGARASLPRVPGRLLLRARRLLAGQGRR